MKKLTVLFIFCSILAVKAQNDKLRLGTNLGLTTGGFNTSFVIGADVDYVVKLGSSFEVGGATGFVFVTEGNSIMMPLALATRFTPSKVSLGLDLGYGVGLNNFNSGFYFRPIIGYDFTNDVQFRFMYSGIESSGYVSLGAMFTI